MKRPEDADRPPGSRAAARARSRARGLAAAMMALTLAGCARIEHPVAGPREQPYDEVTTATYAAAGTGTVQTRRLPPSAYRPRWFFQSRLAPPVPPQSIAKIDSRLSLEINTVPPDQTLRIFITYRDAVVMPRLPRVDVHQPRAALVNLAAMDTVNTIIADLRVQRGVAYGPDTTALQGIPGASIRKTFWLIQGVVADVPAGNIAALAASPDILHIRLNQGSPPPDHDGDRKNDIDTASAQVRTSVLYDLGHGYGWTALLDTGVQPTHRLLRDPRPLCRVSDCVSGDCATTGTLECSMFDEYGATPGGYDVHPQGHGTSSAVILVGNGQLTSTATGTGLPFRGITRSELDSFGVYDSQNVLDVGAAVEGFELAVARLNRVIVAEMAEVTLPDIADVGRAADRAYAAGACIIAAGGNSPMPLAGVPASNHRTLGAGAYMVDGRAEIAEAFGTADHRPKPEVLGPTYTETAGKVDHQANRLYSGTSGATPYVAGAAVLVRDWMSNGGWDIVDPGQVYAYLVLAGDRVGPFGAADKFGAGRVTLPDAGRSWYGKIAVSKGVRHVEIPIDVTEPSLRGIDAAVWWPDSTEVTDAGLSTKPNDVDLEILPPGWGGAVATSESRAGTFERAAWTSSSPLSGKWRVRVIHKALRQQSLDVYWAVRVRPN